MSDKTDNKQVKMDNEESKTRKLKLSLGKAKTSLMAGAIISSVGLFAIPSIAAKVDDDSDLHKPKHEFVKDRNREDSPKKELTDDEKAAKKAEHVEKIEAKLSSLVEEGKLTSEQSELLKAKLEEQSTEREGAQEDRLTKEEMDALSDDERKALFDEKKTAKEANKAEFEQWAHDKGIDTNILKEIAPRGHGGPGHGGPGEGASDK